MYRLLNWVTFVPIFASFALPTALLAYPGLANKKLDLINQKRLDEMYRKLPLSFEVNRGQVDSRVKYVARANGYSVLLGADEVVLTSSRHHRAAHDSRPATAVKHAFGSLKDLAKRDAFENPKTRTSLRLKPVGANLRHAWWRWKNFPARATTLSGTIPKSGSCLFQSRHDSSDCQPQTTALVGCQQNRGR